MNAKRRGLGKGLDALLGNVAKDQDDSHSDAQLRQLAVDLIQPGRYQPRTGMDPDKLKELSESIRSQGVVQPIVVRPIGGGMFEIVAGERRWRAAQMAELRAVPAVIRDVADQAAVAMALIENIQRENLSPLEESGALKRLIEEFDLTHEQAAEAVGRSRAAVSNLLRLQDLQAAVKTLLDSRRLEMGHARALLALEGSDQIRAANQVVQKQLSVRQTEVLVRRWQVSKTVTEPPRQADPDILHLQNELSQRLAAKVQLKHQNGGKGHVVIQYNSLDELDGILERIR